MNEVKKKQVLQLASRMGELMMAYGAESFRVEDTISRICKASGVDNVNVFVVPTGIFISIEPDHEDGEIMTSVRRLYSRTTNLCKMSRLNQISREFTSTDMTVETALSEINRIAEEPDRPLWLMLLGAGIASAFFAVIYSTNIMTFICAFLIGVFAEYLYIILSKIDMNFFIKGFTCCAAAATLSVMCQIVGLTPGYGAVIVGVIMLFTPGAALTNAIRDLLQGGMLSGVSAMAETMLIAVSLAGGVGIVLKIRSLTAPPVSVTNIEIPLWATVILAAAAVAGYSILFYVPWKAMIASCFVGAFGWAACQAMSSMGQSSVVATLLGSFIVAAGALVCSRTLHLPNTVFIIPSIITLVPGALTYFTMRDFLAGNLNSAISLGVDTILTAGAIALGLFGFGAIVQVISQIRKRAASRINKLAG